MCTCILRKCGVLAYKYKTGLTDGQTFIGENDIVKEIMCTFVLNGYEQFTLCLNSYIKVMCPTGIRTFATVFESIHCIC
jgi:hypothetical protein